MLKTKLLLSGVRQSKSKSKNEGKSKCDSKRKSESKKEITEDFWF